LLSRFEKVARPLFEGIVLGTEAVDTLGSLRDTLLPRLISGQLCISEVAEILETV